MISLSVNLRKQTKNGMVSINFNKTKSSRGKSRTSVSINFTKRFQFFVKKTIFITVFKVIFIKNNIYENKPFRFK